MSKFHVLVKAICEDDYLSNEGYENAIITLEDEGYRMEIEFLSVAFPTYCIMVKEIKHE